MMDYSLCTNESSESLPIKNEKDQVKSEITCSNIKTSSADVQENKINGLACNERLASSSNSQSSPSKTSPVKKTITGSLFKDIVYRFYHNDFLTRYNKLSSVHVPECCKQLSCERKHKGISVREIWPNSLCSGPFFNILDNPFDQWVYDLVYAAFSTLRPDRCFRGDVLRTLFHYILNGPSEELMWDIKNIISTHFTVHPPCMEQMRTLYLQLLDQKDNYEYFRVISSEPGVLHLVMNGVEDHFNEKKPCLDESPNKTGNSQEPYETNTHKLTYELMEERYNNYRPVLDVEYNQLMDALDDIVDNSSEEGESVLNSRKRRERLIVALELIVDLLEADFLICTAKLKRYITGEDVDPMVFEPMVKLFMDYDLESKVFELYARAVNKPLWTQLSRLVALMAEKVHLFKPSPERLWKYPDLNQDCHDFATNFFKAICECDWSTEERLLRLQMLHPPWLQQQVAIWWAYAELKVDLKGTDLKAIVDIIHMHVQSPIRFEENNKKVKHSYNVSNNPSVSLLKRAAKRNVYGETILHRLCKRKSSSMAEIYAVLALPETDINAKDNFGWTPLHETVGSNSILKTTILLQYQPPPGKQPVNIGAQNSEGCTPLHEAVQKQNLELCELLVAYGGVCLLSKTDSDGETPLMLAKNFPEINAYFERVIKTQELLNLSPDSLLNLGKYTIRLLIVACNAFLSDHHTSEIYNTMKSEETCKGVTAKPWIVVDQNTLLDFRKDQDQFRKLRRILNMLAENPKNDPFVRLWGSNVSG